MNLTYIPRSQLREALLSGHRLVPGHEYKPGDWAILLQEPAGERLPLYVINDVLHWLAGAQKVFRDTCAEQQLPYAVIRGVGDLQAFLDDLGIKTRVSA